MQRIFQYLIVLTFAFWANLAIAQSSEVPREPDIEATITAQIDAFKMDDFARAFSFASPGIQSFFGSSDRFGSMVRNGYPMVWRPGDVEYLELRDVSGSLWQRVKIIDQSGRTHVLDYQMIRTQAGWKINGVQLLPSPGVNA